MNSKNNKNNFGMTDKFTLPNSPTQTISFVASFYFSDMYYKKKVDYLPFFPFNTYIFNYLVKGCKQLRKK